MKKLICTLVFIWFICFCSFSQQTDTTQLPQEERVQEIFHVIEEEAQPKGGMQAFYELLAQNLQYPPEALEKGIEGIAYVRFVIKANGEITSVDIVEGRELGYGMDEEAIRLIKLTEWIPGKSRGVKVAQRKIIPVRFKLPLDKDAKKRNKQ